MVLNVDPPTPTKNRDTSRPPKVGVTAQHSWQITNSIPETMKTGRCVVVSLLSTARGLDGTYTTIDLTEGCEDHRSKAESTSEGCDTSQYCYGTYMPFRFHLRCAGTVSSRAEGSESRGDDRYPYDDAFMDIRPKERRSELLQIWRRGRQRCIRSLRSYGRWVW